MLRHVFKKKIENVKADTWEENAGRWRQEKNGFRFKKKKEIHTLEKEKEELMKQEEGKA